MTVWNTDHKDHNSQITNIYHTELKNIINSTLLPNTKVKRIDPPHAVNMRGPSGASGKMLEAYAGGIHQDYNLAPNGFGDSV